MKCSREVFAPLSIVAAVVGIICNLALGARAFDTNGLWLEMELNFYPVQTNYVVRTNNNVVRTNRHVTLTYNAASFTVIAPATNANGVYDLYFKTNLVDLQDWAWLSRCASGQTNLTVSNLPPGQGFFQLETASTIRPGFDQQILDRNDDGSTDIVPMGFSINFFGNTNATLYVNNNGDVTFTSPESDYTPKTLANLGVQVIAPFWADVDTRNTNSAVVQYGTGTVDGHAAFGVDWVNVGYYYEHADKLLSCQLVIIDRSDIDPCDFDMEFNYEKVQWQWGDFTPGVPPRAGFSDGTDADDYELVGSGVDGAFLDTNMATGLIYHSLNSSVPGRYFFSFRNGEPLGPLP